MRALWWRLLVGTVASALYWAAVVAIAYSLLAGDPREGDGPGIAPIVALGAVGTILWLFGLWRACRPAGRPLTAGELAAAKGVFGEAIDWARVRVYARGFTPFQPKHVAVTPLGAVHFRRADFRPDFAAAGEDMAWLIHELAHVWQYQTGVPVILRGLWERRYHYGALDAARPLHRYGIEQQAAIVEDWFRRRCGEPARRGSGSDADYRAVIPFLPR